MEVSIPIVFLAGLLSFLSPCVLPLVLPYISLISGISVSNIKQGKISVRDRVRIVISTLYFTIGFTIIFIVFGVIAGQVGEILSSVKEILSRVMGIIVLVFGLHIIGLLRIPFLEQEKRIGNFSSEKASFLTAFLMGVSFALGWTPCVGPILGTVVGIALHSGSMLYGGALLGVYSLGFSLPFFIISVFIESSVSMLSKARKALRAVGLISGGILVLVGILLITDTMETVSQYFIGIFQ
ncbi:MAG: cytochrome c biogenesis protein CcdA [Brevinematia bacterium]